ncbi:kinase-like domain-containing protein, partial [Glomus cerebriforme]
MSNNAELIFTNDSNEWIDWIENAISNRLIKYYEFENFYNIQEIGSGAFGMVYRANWKISHEYLALKSFYNFNNVTAKEVVSEIKLQREVDFHENIISFYGVTSYCENFVNLTWNDKFNIAFQLVYAVSCLHGEGIIHRDLHSKNILIHQNTIKLRILVYQKGLMNHPIFNQNDVYSVGVLLWEISSGQPPFCKEQHDIGLAMEILQGYRETPIPDTPEAYVKIYKDCWNGEPDNRPIINQVVDELKAIITKENIGIKDFHLYSCNKNTQSSNNSHLILNTIKNPENIINNSLHGDLSQVIQNFNEMDTEEIEHSMPPSDQIIN